MDSNLGLRFTIIFGVVGLCVIFLAIFDFNYGIDLRGGYTVSYLIEPKESDDPEEPQVTRSTQDLVASTIAVMKKRVNSKGLLDIKFIPEGADRIKVQLPGADQAQANEIRKMLTALGRLEFRIVANPTELERGGVDRETERLRRLEMEKEAAALAADGRIGEVYSGPDGPAGDLFAWYYYDLETYDAAFDPEEGLPGLYVKLGDEHGIGGDDIRNVFPGVDNRSGAPAVEFRIRSQSTVKFSTLTTQNLKRLMAIVLNGKVNSAPEIQAELSTGGIITGGRRGFTSTQVDTLIAVLQSGSLELKPKLLSEDLIGPTLGEDAISRGKTAMMIGMIAVLGFMVIYYRVAGLIADLALLLTLFIMLGVLLLFSATLTLPGIAGIVLTVGMAVDANILIFERIREERDKGKTLLQSVKNGYEQAFRAIFDSNLTTFATAMILVIVGTEMIKGFGVTLAIGIASSMFSALFVTKSVFLFLIGKGYLKQLNMMKLIGVTRIDFLRYAGLATVLSLIVISGGLGIFFSRGDEKYSIDFTGGEVVQVSLREPVGITDMRKRVASIDDESGAAKYPDAEVVSILVPGVERGRSTRFEISSKVEAERADELRTDLARMLKDELLPQPIPVMERIPENTEGVPAGFGGKGFRFSLTLSTTLAESDIREKLQSVAIDGGSLVLNRDEEASARAGSEWVVYSIMGRGTQPGLDEASLTSQIHRAFGGTGGAKLFPEPIPKSATIGKIVAKDLKNRAILAIGLSLLFMIFYIRFRFHEYKYGFAAAICLFHDVIVTLGMCVLFNWLGLIDVKISYAIIAVFLTIVGYSLNDTIVIFDRVRENVKKAKGSFKDTFNKSINETLSRTILTSLTTLFVVLVLLSVNYGQKSQLEGFAFALLVGIISGTYSTIYIASPVVVRLESYLKKKEQETRKRAGGQGGQVVAEPKGT